MLLHHPGAPDERHLRVRFTLATDDGPLEMRFVDQRMFGGLLVSDGGAELPTEIAHIGRDPLDPEFDEADFVRRVRRRASAIKRQLLDQSLVSGVGNIYADEALWRTGVHGERPGDRLTAAQVRELIGHARDVMTDALAQGGTSFDALYVNVNGESGYFDRSLHAYGREGEAVRALRHPDPPGRLHEPVVVLLPDLPAPRRAGPRVVRRDAPVPVDRPPPRWDSCRWPGHGHPHRKGCSMAKALIGHLAGDPRTTARLATDNRRLRARVTELETLVLRLQAENDQLEARLDGARTAAALDPEMLPA